MSRYSKKTKLNTSEVIDNAINFFGEDGLGLEVTDKESEMIRFEGVGGHVKITACSNDKTEVDIETREWDYQAKKFMKKL